MNTNDIEIRFSDMENRLAFSENRYRYAMRKMKVQSLLGLTALGITLCFSSIPHAMAQGYGTSLSTLINEVKALQTQQTTDMSNISNLQARQTSFSQSLEQLQSTIDLDSSEIVKLNGKTMYLTSSKTGLTIDAPSITLEDENTPTGADPTQLVMQGSNLNLTSANFSIVNGLGNTFGYTQTETGNLVGVQAHINGLGNLIIGYDTEGTITGSHNLIMGYGNNVSSFGAVVSGLYNTSSAPFATVLNGFENSSGGLCSSILGGQNNTTIGDFSLISSGRNNLANGAYSSILGGYLGVADDSYSAILGGYKTQLNSGSSFTYGP